jgi:hypothetical protein
LRGSAEQPANLRNCGSYRTAVQDLRPIGVQIAAKQ